MKHLYILSLFTLALCLTTTANAQEKTAPENDKKIIVIKKTVDADGTVTIEKTITTGEEGEQVFVTVDSDGVHKIEEVKGDGNAFFISSGDSEDGEMQSIEVTVDGNSDKKMVWVTSGDSEEIVGGNIDVIVEGDPGNDAIFITSGDFEKVAGKNIEVNVIVNENGKVITIVRDGETEVIELEPGEELSEEQRDELLEKGVHVIDDHTMIGQDGEEAVFFSDDNTGLARKIRVMTDRMTDFNFNFDFDHNMNFGRIAGGGTNCIALGVFVNSNSDGGVSIQRIIDGSGAQDAGLESGDIIHGIGEDAVDSYRALHLALSNYEPGEIVTVKYERDDATKSVEAELRAWGDLPGYEDSWRAQVKCGEENATGAPKVTKRIIIIKKGGDRPPVDEDTVERNPTTSASPEFDYGLNMASFRAFPNPTDGKFNVQFEAEAKPLTVSVFDATGKEIYRDNVKDFDGYYDEEIDLRGMSTGALILSIAQDGKRYSEQIILQ